MMAVVDETKGFMAQTEGRLMKYIIKDENKIVSTPLHFEKDCEIYDMVWANPLKILLVYCHSTSTDKNSKKSKIISFNFNKPNPTPTVYFNNYQAPVKRGKIMKLNRNQNWLYLAECENAGSHSNVNLRVLGELAVNQPKINYSVKISGVLKEFDVIGNDKVIVLTNDNKI